MKYCFKRFGSEWKSRNVYILRRLGLFILWEVYTFSLIGFVVLKCLLNQSQWFSLYYFFSLISQMTFIDESQGKFCLIQIGTQEASCHLSHWPQWLFQSLCIPATSSSFSSHFFYQSSGQRKFIKQVPFTLTVCWILWVTDE